MDVEIVQYHFGIECARQLYTIPQNDCSVAASECKYSLLGTDTGCCVELCSHQPLFLCPVQEKSFFSLEVYQFALCADDEVSFYFIRQNAVDIVAYEGGVFGAVVV